MKNHLIKFVRSLRKLLSRKIRVFIREEDGLFEFDEEFYLEANRDVRDSWISATDHFVRFGHKENRTFAIKNGNYRGFDLSNLQDLNGGFGPKVGVIFESFDGFSPTPCSSIRLIQPLTDLFNLRELQFESFKLDCCKDYDFIIFNRTALSESLVYEILKNKRLDTRLVYDVDDFLWGSNTSKKDLTSICMSFLVADFVTVSTNALKNRVEQDFGITAEVVRNSSYFVKNKLDLKPHKIIYFGTRTHMNDWKLVEDALMQIHNEFPELEIHILGAIDENYKLPKFIRIISDEGLHDYKRFINTFSSIENVLLGIAPIDSNEFNACKSAIKFYDYQMVCKYVVASNVGEYVEIEDPRLFKVTNNTFKEWVDVLRHAIKIAREDNSENHSETKKIASLNKLNGVFHRREPEKLMFRKGLNNLGTGTVRKIIFDKYFQGNGIEIGALHNPLNVSKKVSVKYLDRLSRAELYEHYPELAEHSLVDIDIIDDGEKLTKIEDDSLDFIIANHMIEHCRNPIGTLINFQKKLKKNGLIYLAIPDARYTFDAGREHTTLSHLLSDSYDDGVSSELKHYEEWVRVCEKNIGYQHTSEDQISERIRELFQKKYSIHFHVWTAEEFAEQIKAISDMELIGLKIIESVSIAEEMIVVLRKE